MPHLDFMPQFVEPIRTGVKHHTIRATRSIPVKPGDNLYLYTDLRHKGAFRILPEPVVCTRIQAIEMRQSMIPGVVSVFIDGDSLGRDEKQCLAIADGFQNFAEMMKFWEGHLPFEGQIIHWK